MKTFKDNAGRTWTIALNVTTQRRIRDLAQVNVLEILGDERPTLYERLQSDTILLCDVLYAACQPQAEKEGVTDEQFGEALAGDAIDHATKALLDEIVDFSPSPRDRANLRKVIDALDQGMEKTRDLIKARLDAGELDRVIEQALVTVNTSSGSVPASSELTPAP